MKNTKRALLTSILSLLLCCSMLIGTTFAWFTDEVVSKNNIITAGNLDVELEYAKVVDGKITDWATVQGADAIFDPNALWEPGRVEVVYLKVSNLGTLELKYQLGVNVYKEIAGKNVAGEEFKLSDHLVFKAVTMENLTTYSDREAVKLASGTEKGLTDYNGTTTRLEVKGVDYVALIVYMPETVGNEANYRGTDIPQITLGVNLYATQQMAENDSFGDDYDQGAPIVSVPAVRPENPQDVTLKGPEDVLITLPAEVVDALPAGVEEIGMAVSEPVVDTTANIITFDSIELIDQNGNVIDLESLNLTEDITVALPLPENAPFADGDTVMVYHDGEYVANATVQNGVITYKVAHLCEVTIAAVETPEVDEETGKIKIGTVSQLFAFAQSVNAGEAYAGKTVVLTADIDLNNVNWTSIGNWDNTFEGTFDGNGYTISNLYINNPTGEGVGLFGVVQNATIKGITLHNVNINAYSMVAGVVGAAYPANISDCHITGDVEIVAEWAYVAGVAGYCYYGTQVDGCSVIAEGTGLINSVTRNAVGGITAWLLEGNHNVTDCQVKNLNLVGWTNVGGITGFVHYNNTIEGCSVENVTLTKTRADGNPGIGLIAGGFSYSASNAITLRNNTVKNATMEGTHIAYAAYNELYGSEYGGATTTNFVLENNTTENITNNLTEVTKVGTADALIEALEKGENVVLSADVKIDPAGMSNAYGTTGINVKNGQTIDGNGNVLDIKGAGGTWDSGINTTGGLIQNITVTGSFRGIFINHNSTHSETVVLKNVIIDGTTYTISCDQGMNQNLEAYNSTFNGWTSYAATIGNVKFDGCSFGEGNGYAFCRPYAPTTFVNCNFEAGFEIDPRAAVTFENCYLDGVLITADNLATLVTSNIDNATVK